ncbi:unnamed protein product, partial [Heterotrigona itama]
ASKQCCILGRSVNGHNQFDPCVATGSIRMMGIIRKNGSNGAVEAAVVVDSSISNGTMCHHLARNNEK